MNFLERFNQWVESASRLSGGLVDRALRSWKTVAAAVVFLLVVSAASLVYALQPHPHVSQAPMNEVIAPTSTPAQLGRALDGVLVDASSTHLLPLGVMVENSADAWPLQGPAKANIVFEAPVEGGITRFLLLFDASSTVDEIGPVRSARPYYVDWANSLHAVYAHVGGSPDALGLIRSTSGFQDLDQYFNDGAFWRTARRYAPHNVYTSIQKLVDAAAGKQYAPASFTPWTYADVSTSTVTSTEPAVSTIKVPYESLYVAEWRYDQATDEYARYRNGAPVTDADGTAVRVKNVVLILTDAQVLDEKLRLGMRTTGKGKALIFNGGKKFEAQWNRSAGEYIRFSGIDGSEASFTRGKTWVSVITRADDFASILPK